MITSRFPAALLAVSVALMFQGEAKSLAKKRIRPRGSPARLVVTVEHLKAEENSEVLRIGNAGTVPDQNESGFSIPFHSGDLGADAMALVPFDEKGTLYSLSNDETTCGFMEKTASSSRRICCVVARAGGALMTYPNVNFRPGNF
jgi:hypothetical protein